MTRRTKLVGSALFTVVNFAGGIFALAQGEPSHALVHAILLFVGIYSTARYWTPSEDDSLASDPGTDARIALLQQSVDAIALEVERIGEAQRYIAKRASEQVERVEQQRQP